MAAALAGALAAVVAVVAWVRVVDPARPPSAWTVIPSRPKVTLTEPSRSVRYTWAPDARSRSRVCFVGWP